MKLVTWIVLFLLLASGCSEKPLELYNDVNVSCKMEDMKKEERALLKRAVEYWHLRSEQQFEKSYLFETPLYRYNNDIKRYLSISTLAPKHFKTEIISIDIDPNTPSVARVRRRFYKKDYIHREEGVWYLVNGIWYHRFYVSPFPG